MNATSIVPNSAPAARGVNNPSTSAAPAASSVMLASQACRMPGFMPRLANHPAVPLILPPRQMWLYPCASIVAPTESRRTNNPSQI